MSGENERWVKRTLSVPQVPVQIYTKLDPLEKRVVDSWVKKGETTLTDSVNMEKRKDEKR
jgi:hypothetical protein